MRSSEDFVKSLKAPDDPPNSGTKKKIQLARDAWDDPSFVIPSKEKLIVEWILMRFLKDAKNMSTCDTRHWALLTDILSTSDKSPVWLTPILTSIPFAPILTNLLKELPHLGPKDRQEIIGHTSRAMRFIWPLAVTRMSADTLLDCFGALLADAAIMQDLTTINSFVVASYRSSLANSGNKKKLYTTFSQSHLRNWVQCVQSGADGVYEAGAETLFSLEALRHNVDYPLDLSEAIDHSGRILPRLLASYIQSLRKYKTALFGHGSASAPDSLTQEVASKGMEFYAICQKILKMKTQAWHSRVELLKVVAIENLTPSQSIHAEAVLKSELQEALACLVGGQPPAEAIRVLTSLVNIDARLFDGLLPRVLSSVTTLPCSAALDAVVIEFLDCILDYHIKIRSLHTFVDAWFTSLSMLATAVTPDSYDRACSGVMFVGQFRDKLASSLNKFLTPNQNTELVQSCLTHLQSSKLVVTPPSSEERPRKKRRTAETDGYAAITFILSLKIAALAISSVPHRYSQPFYTNIQEFVEACNIAAFAKSLMESDWILQVTAAALLRFCRELTWSLEGLSVPIRGKALRRLEELLVGNGITPELQVEVVCTLLAYSTENPTVFDPERAIDLALGYVEKNLKPSASWSGYPSQLGSITSPMDCAGLAVLEALVLDRFLTVLNASGSPHQLQRLSAILASMDLEQPIHEGRWTPATVVHKLLHNAIFWELAALREAMMAQLENQVLDSEKNSRIYSLLVCVPMEYLTRNTRTKLAQRATELDSSSVSISENTRTCIRVFLARVHTFQALAETDVHHVVKSLMSLFRAIPGESQALRVATIELIEVYTLTILKAASTNDYTGFLQLLGLFSASGAINQPMIRDGFAILVRLLNRDFAINSFDGEVQPTIRELHSEASKLFRNEIAKQSLSGTLVDPQNINGWTTTVSLGQWLGVKEHTIYGLCLAAALSKQDIARKDSEYLTCVMDLLFIEALGSVERLALAIATYVWISRATAHLVQNTISLRIRNACKSLEVEEYGTVLSIVSQALSDIHTANEDLSGLLRITLILVQESPYGALKHVQKFFYQCLTAFANTTKFTREDTRISLLVARFLSYYLLDRAPALKSTDIVCLWAILAQITSSSKEHDPYTSLEVFHECVSALTSLVRLRRDLVVSTLPHLGMILQRLTTTLRTLRPSLGGKQSRMTLETLPRWISNAQPLGVSEAKALSRLLESLTVKTVPRTYHTTTEQHTKAESLAKPFSKHAAYVIGAYIDTINDPLCIVPIEMRRALEPGLFALCDMMNEHSRDALVVSALDPNGKVVMKELWKAYSAQKYSGQG